MTRRGRLCLTGWGGSAQHEVIIVAETPKRYRIKLPDGASWIRLPSRRTLQPGDTALVPKHAVRLHEEDR